VLGAELAQFLQIALRRRQHAGRTGHRLDDDGGDGVGAMQRDQTLDVVGEFGAVLREVLRECVAFEIVGVADVIGRAVGRTRRRGGY
jgi:hypothetical protein